MQGRLRHGNPEKVPKYRYLSIRRNKFLENARRITSVVLTELPCIAHQPLGDLAMVRNAAQQPQSNPSAPSDIFGACLWCSTTAEHKV
jgi:hypothetical protein